MYLLNGTCALRKWVPPFGYLRVIGYVLLTAAFRSLSRPSSASGAKASALCSFLLNLNLFKFVDLTLSLPGGMGYSTCNINPSVD